MPVEFTDRTQVPSLFNILGSAISAGGQGYLAGKDIQRKENANKPEMGGPPTDQIVGGPVAPAPVQATAGGAEMSPAGMKAGAGGPNNNIANLLQLIQSGGFFPPTGV